MEEICCWKERVGSRQTPMLRTVLASLMLESSRFMDCGTVRVENLLCNCSWLFVIHDIRDLYNLQDWFEWMISGWETLPDLYSWNVIRETVMWKRVIGYNFRNRMSINSENQFAKSVNEFITAEFFYLLFAWLLLLLFVYLLILWICF